MYYRVLVASQRYHGQDSLTYNSTQPQAVGQIVGVPLQNKIVLGIVESVAEKPEFATKHIASSWPFAIPNRSISLLNWLREYYPSPLGLITELFTPPNMPKKLPEPGLPELKVDKIKLPPLTPEQISTIKNIDDSLGQSILLHGDTGTGKTRIYQELAIRTLRAGKSVIILTPEIGLTEPLLKAFTDTFEENVLITHSEMTPAQRRNVWLRASDPAQKLIVIGPRSALFTPLNNIGLIVMDEAHDGAYKQEQAPHYQTSRVASQLAKLHNARFVMGTATPLISDYYTFSQKNLPVIRMNQSAIKITSKTHAEIIDQREKNQFIRSPWLANSLIDAIDSAIKSGEQSLLFLNRRGSARLVFCEQCGWQALCPRCDVPLTYHQDQHAMLCHSCDFIGKVPTNCPTCGKNELIFRSIGTKALEKEIQKLFPRATVSRFDRDTEKQLRLPQQYKALHSGEIDIVIGTQTVVKGFDLPKLSVVGIVQADSGLQLPDYSAAERTFQLISQVSGRIGRGHRGGKLFVQTYDPESSLIKSAISKDYNSFYVSELEQRQQYNFPPFVFLLKVTCTRATSKAALRACQDISDNIRKLKLSVQVEGPSPRFIEKIAGRYAWHLIVRAKHRTNLLEVVRSLPSNCSYDLDPGDLL